MTAKQQTAYLDSIPAWVIEKKYGRGSVDAAACILALQSGSAAVVRETAKAILVNWGNTELAQGCAGGEFWVPKSVLA